MARYKTQRVSLHEQLKQLAEKAEKRLSCSRTFNFESYNKGDSFEEYLLYKANPQCLTRGDIINLASREPHLSNNFCATAVKHLNICKSCRAELLDWIIFYIKQHI